MVLIQSCVHVRPVDVAVQCLSCDIVVGVVTKEVDIKKNIECTDAVADRAKPFHRLVGDEFGASNTEVRAPDVVSLTFDAKLVLPGDSGDSLADELGMNLSWFSNPWSECIFEDRTCT